jgi:hypothetical protein
MFLLLNSTRKENPYKDINFCKQITRYRQCSRKKAALKRQTALRISRKQLFLINAAHFEKSCKTHLCSPCPSCRGVYLVARDYNKDAGTQGLRHRGKKMTRQRSVSTSFKALIRPLRDIAKNRAPRTVAAAEK